MKFNYYAFRAMYFHEMDRFKRTLMQSLFSPVLSTSLYFIVFGSVIGGYVEKIDGELKDISFNNIEYFSFDVSNKKIADLFNVQYQTTLLIFKNNKEVYRSLGETTKDLIYEAIKSSI